MPKKVTPTQIIIVGIALIGLAIVVWRISDVVIIVFGGVVGAATLRALALPLTRLVAVSETWAISITLVLLLVLFIGATWLFGSQVMQQAGELRQSAPEAWHALVSALDRNQLGQALVEALGRSTQGDKAMAGVTIATGALLSGAIDAVVLVFLSIYLAYEPGEYMEGCLRLIPPARRSQVRNALFDAGRVLRSWVLAQLIAMVVIGVMVGVGMALLGVPFALLLGCFAGLMEFIPVAGAIVFTIPGVLLAFAKGPMLALYALLAYIVVQQLESNLIIPLLQRWAVRIAPGITLVSVVLGGVLFGAVGVIFATPLAVVVMALTKHLYVEDTLERNQTRTQPAPHTLP